MLLWKYPKKYAPGKNIVTISVFLFLFSFAISTFTGVDWYRSLWDNHERMLGLFTFVHYVIYFFVLSSVIQSKEEWIQLFRFFLGAGMLVVIIGVWQKSINPELLLNRGAFRVSSTLGNAIYLSGYGLFLATIGALLAYWENVNMWRIYAAIGAFLGIVGIFLGGTRGTLLGFLAGLGIGLAWFIFYAKANKRMKKFVLLGTSCLLMFFVSLFFFRSSDVVRHMPLIGRLAETSLSSGTAETRIMAWQIAFEAWKDKPFFGWGPNNFYYAFNEFYNPTFLEHGYQETWFDNAHNIVMNTLTTQGAFGLAVYIILFGGAIYALIKMKDDDILGGLVSVIIVSFLIAHFIHNVFVFENPTSYLYFFTILGFIASSYKTFLKKTKTVKVKNVVSQHLGVGKMSILLFVALLFVFSTEINPARANKTIALAIKSVSTDPELSIAQYRKATSIPSPHIDDIRNDMSRIYLQAIPFLIDQHQNEIANTYFAEAKKSMEENLLLHPRDIRVHMQLAQVLLQGARLKQDISYIQQAKQILRIALVYSPKRQQLVFQYTQILDILTEYDEALSLLRQVVDDDPHIVESWARLIYMYGRAGEKDLAVQVYQEALTAGIDFSGDFSNTVNSVISASTSSTSNIHSVE
ncbi:MAG: hypothetical protein AUJ37_01205 [Candidatus Magasanikbacteria bacterium CG1_02_41_34]|nr:MAG: hypothetical protein AUJ37_01205 [Candidatus Magasanikbacteria bacterium CG1_02_41_34]